MGDPSKNNSYSWANNTSSVGMTASGNANPSITVTKPSATGWTLNVANVPPAPPAAPTSTTSTGSDITCTGANDQTLTWNLSVTFQGAAVNIQSVQPTSGPNCTVTTVPNANGMTLPITLEGSQGG